MSIDYSQLASIHGLLQQRSELESRIARIPKLIKDVEAGRAAAQSARDAAKEALTAAKRKSHEQQLTLKQREDHIERLKAKRNACETNREYQILSDQIAADLQANAVLSDEILDLLERIERMEQDDAAAVENLKKIERECQLSIEQLRLREATLRRELQSVQDDLRAAELLLPGDVAGPLRRIVETRGASALSATDGETCGECHQVLTVQTRSELVQQQVVFCKGCGSLMYLAPAVIAANPN